MTTQVALWLGRTTKKFRPRLEQSGDVFRLPHVERVGMPFDHRAMIEHRLEKSQRIIERQRELIARRRAAGHPTMHSEKVLATFERTHAAFERSLRGVVTVQEMTEWPY